MVKAKSKVTGAISLITKSAYAQGKKYFKFIEEVQADKDGNEIQPKQAAPAPELTASPKLNPQEQNQSQNEEEKDADPVVVSDTVIAKKKPGPKPKTAAE
jgi:hypothetical protein